MTIKSADFPEKSLPPQFYVAVVLISMMILVGSLIQEQIMKKMIRLLKENEELIKTIRAILEMFPESVIIQSYKNDSEKWDIDFVNNTAKNNILLDGFKNWDAIFKFAHEPDKAYDLYSLLDKHNKKLEENMKTLEQINDYWDAIIDMIEPPLHKKFVRNGSWEESLVRSLHMKSMQVTWEKNKKSFMHIFVDTTNVKRLEEEKAKIKCQNIMLASVSHEFRTPLNAFENSLQLIKLKVDELASLIMPIKINSQMNHKIDGIYAMISKFLKIGNVSSKLLMHLVEDILDLGKFEAGTFSHNNSEFTISEIVEDLAFIFENQWQQKGLKFIVDVCKDLQTQKFISDQGRIKQVLMNLLSNSLKFTQKGFIEIGIKRKSGLNKIVFSVFDTGVGIPKKDQHKLFKMFSMLDKYKNQLNQKGTGIGLAISQKIVESLGGRISVKSKENEYTKFEFTIEVESLNRRKFSSSFENKSPGLM
jgi:signal transduction histidine kinase